MFSRFQGNSGTLCASIRSAEWKIDCWWGKGGQPARHAASEGSSKLLRFAPVADWAPVFRSLTAAQIGPRNLLSRRGVSHAEEMARAGQTPTIFTLAGAEGAEYGSVVSAGASAKTVLFCRCPELHIPGKGEGAGLFLLKRFQRARQIRGRTAAAFAKICELVHSWVLQTHGLR